MKFEHASAGNLQPQSNDLTPKIDRKCLRWISGCIGGGVYELILKSIESDFESSSLAEKLRKRHSLPTGELNHVLNSGPITIEVSLSRDSLLPLYRDIKRCGGNVSIVEHGQELHQNTSPRLA